MRRGNNNNTQRRDALEVYMRVYRPATLKALNSHEKIFSGERVDIEKIIRNFGNEDQRVGPFS